MPQKAPVLPADISQLRREIRELVARNAITMVQHAIDAVNEEGQYQAIKYLFEMIGLYPSSADDETAVEDSLANTLLHCLGLSKSLPPQAGQQEKESTVPYPVK